jgi:hemolysin activation/secretion protein
VNYQKLDAALAMALNQVQNPEERNLVVFIQTEPVTDSTAKFLENLGVSSVTTGRNMFTATLSANAVSQLSDQSWVKYLKLSQKLRLLNRP